MATLCTEIFVTLAFLVGTTVILETIVSVLLGFTRRSDPAEPGCHRGEEASQTEAEDEARQAARAEAQEAE